MRFDMLSRSRIWLAAAAVSVLLGCRGAQNEPLEFAVGGVPAEMQVWQQVIAAFTAATGQKVDLLRQPADSDQRRQGLAVALQAGQSRPDVFLMDVAWIPQFAASHWLSPLSVTGDTDLPGPQSFPAGALAVDSAQGRLVALPVYIDGGLLYYRQDLLTKYGFTHPPETWDSLVAMARKVQAGERRHHPDFYGYVWQGAQYEGLVCDYLEVAASAGGGLNAAAPDLDAAQPANVRALRFLTSLVGPGGISPPETYTEMKEEEVRRYFQRGAALFERNWPYAWALHQAADSPVRGLVGMAPLPHFPGHVSAATLGGWHVGISRFTRHSAAARKLVGYLVSLPVQRRLALQLGWNPGRMEIYRDTAVLARRPDFKELRTVFAHAVARPNVPYWSPLSEVLQRHLNAALAGKATPEAALQAAQRELAAVTARYRDVGSHD